MFRSFVHADRPRRPLKLTARRQEGQGLVDYALILVLIAIVVIGALSVLGGSVQEALAQVDCRMSQGEFDGTDGATYTATCRNYTMHGITFPVVYYHDGVGGKGWYSDPG